MAQTEENRPPPRDWLGRTLLESILIVLGIVLGFIVNEWREDLERAERADAAMGRIIEELSDNRAKVAAVLPYHREVAQRLRALLADPPMAPMIDTFMGGVAPNGVGDLLLQDEAWKTASARDSLATVDFETVQAIAGVYNIADSGARGSWQQLIALFSDPQSVMPDTGGYMLRRFSLGYDLLVSQEEYLLVRYDAVLARLGALPAGTEGD